MPKILVVEDDATVRDLLRVLLQTEGYETVEAGDGLEGLLKAEFGKPDLMILDLMMPDVDGERMLEQIHGDPNLSSVPVIIVSGKYEALDDMRQSLGDENVFAKPFEPSRLLARVAELLNKKG